MKHNCFVSVRLKFFRLWLRILITGILTAYVTSTTSAQQRPTHRAGLARSIPEQFAGELETLARRAKVTFVVEGQPVVTRADTMPADLQADLHKEGAAREVLIKAVAAYYDYSAVRQGNMFLLTKLYTDPTEIPDVTPQECYLTLKSASQTLASFNPRILPSDRSGDPIATDIVGRLTPQQIEALSHNGLTVASLTALQREAVWRITLYYYVQTEAQELEGVTSQLQALTEQDPLFHWKQMNDFAAFGCDLELTTLHRTLFFPISHANRVFITPRGETAMMTSHRTVNGIAVEDFDPTDATVNRTAKKSTQISPVTPTITTTLAAAVAKLNEQDKARVHCQVDAALAAKRVMIVGKGEPDTAKLMDALANLYGLRVRHANDGALILMRQLDLSTPDIMGMSKVLRGMMPVP